MTVEFWFIAALIPILSAAVLCYVIARLIWAGLRGFATLLGFGPARRLPGPFDPGPDRRASRTMAYPDDRHTEEVRTTTVHERRVCTAPDCRRANPMNARFCAQCGRRL